MISVFIYSIIFEIRSSAWFVHVNFLKNTVFKFLYT